jgi:hypothetical protein
MVQYFNCWQMRESGFITNYKFVLGVGAKAKTVTSLFTLLTVLAADVCPALLQDTKRKSSLK